MLLSAPRSAPRSARLWAWLWAPLWALLSVLPSVLPSVLLSALLSAPRSALLLSALLWALPLPRLVPLPPEQIETQGKAAEHRTIAGKKMCCLKKIVEFTILQHHYFCFVGLLEKLLPL